MPETKSRSTLINRLGEMSLSLQIDGQKQEDIPKGVVDIKLCIHETYTAQTKILAMYANKILPEKLSKYTLLDPYLNFLSKG